jgi:diguanylate cyclase (GGDEF)-like protein
MQTDSMSLPSNAAPSADTDELLFADDLPQDDRLPSQVWRVLIVDDEPDVHRATTFALSDVMIMGRTLEFLHAYSSEQAVSILRQETGIAVILLDVVMESEHAGLELVRIIRQSLKLSDVRIILRTGQPGQAPEIETIHDYDINDYKTKSELTRTKLYASITSAVRAYQQIRALDELAFYDRLSRLPNRNRFIDLVEEQLKQAGGKDQVIAILDIDDFAEVNDALGHQQGDRLLQAVAERLRSKLGQDILLARIGGDTFGLMGRVSTLYPFGLLDLFHEPFSVLDGSMVVTATLGLVRLNDVRGGGLDALKDANIALKRAKKNRRGSYVLYSPEMGFDIRERVRLLRGLRSAVDNERLFIVYQPQIHLDTGRVVGLEALLRWRDDKDGFVPPDQFIPLAETSGLIVVLGDWVLRTACHELMRFQGMGWPKLRMSVNVSQVQFRHPAFLAKLQAALLDTGINPGDLELELTESIAMEDAGFILDTLTAIKALGISIAIDDFGTGYSSLSQLRQLPVDRLKIDRVFVGELDHEVQGGHIANMVVELGRNLGLTVIAEGVEEEAQAQALRAMGCHEAQGFLYARPLAVQDLKNWLIEHDPPMQR